MYKHIIWDFDGTLFDTYPVMGSAFKKMLEKEGIEEPLDEILKHMKVSMTNALQHYDKKYHIDSVFIKKFDKLRKEMEVYSCKPYAGIEEICKYIYTSGRNNYLYTHRGESAIIFLQKFGLYPYFKDFITSQQGFERKPSPDAIQYLIGKHNMIPSQAVMIGDRDLDMLSAKNAGIHACFFAEGEAKSSVADFTINNFHELFDIL